jgi:hypothetical protein
MPEIAEELGVSKSSVSLWVRDVEFDRKARRSATTRAYPRGSDHPGRRRKLAEIERLRVEGIERIGEMTDRESLLAGLGLYAGDGSKRDGELRFANSNPTMVGFMCAWLRRHFDIDEERLRVRLYLHEGLDLEAANSFWSEVTGVPENQFHKPYRAVPDATIRHNKHEHGCAHLVYGSARIHREIMGLIHAMLSPDATPEP